ncbi:pyridoxamine 5'-phosphate oxidase family protein [Methylovorus sp. MP688]|uniref:pyridoxamine 5'-phosphate oxidase family protein n=1 Tax=Methylovorus sp. (strain MP688) TaxID=887061 RepID=UPI0001EC4F7A|nr:pyridoxamine 5'-phosphate oxidase family protein [Methylovorus sp. MP688]ADQ85728.1 pyridoxamine 5'-phosphate oxidase-related FMN-binding protein [Methylovorus sp. MP688]
MQTRFHFHAGERAVQRHAGQAFIADRNAAMIADTILGGARPFIEKQFMVVLSSIAADGAVWSSVLYAEPGFAKAEGDAALALHIPVDERDMSDPFWTNIDHHPAVGLLFIELGSRRRYRINGMIQHMHDQGIVIGVNEAYPNCPKYIQRRHLQQFEKAAAPHEVLVGTQLQANIAALVRNADTMFVATHYADTGADASHRGGNPGFVQIINDSTLRIPDYHGNSMFNTLGNMEIDARTGVCIPDFAGQQLLQLSGKSRLLWDQDDPHNLSGGTGRFWEFDIAQWILRKVPQHLEWQYLDASPFNMPVEA